MEGLNYYSTKEYDFTIWFFRLIMVITATCVLLLFVLNINEAVSITEGEIIASNPQMDFKAPYEGQVSKIKVKEGQSVRVGDTLLIIQNLEYLSQQRNRKIEIDYLTRKLESIGTLQEAIRKKKAATSHASVINSSKHELDIRRLTNEIRTLDEQYSLQRERLNSAEERFFADSILYKKDMLSKVDFNNSKDANLLLKENFSNVAREKERQLSEKTLSYNNYVREQNDLMLKQVELDESETALLQTKNELSSQVTQAKEALTLIERELAKQYIVATMPGIVNFLFNTRQSSDLINKGDLLISIAPLNSTFYAKAVLPQKDVQYLRPGLDAHLKLDAYYHWEHGILKGKISYIADRKENEKFYALIQLSDSKAMQLRSGYSFRGEIILGRMPLYRYLIKLLFKKFESR